MSIWKKIYSLRDGGMMIGRIVSSVKRWLALRATINVIAKINAGKISVTGFSDQDGTLIYYTSNGYEIDIFVDSCEWDYISSIRTPDGILLEWEPGIWEMEIDYRYWPIKYMLDSTRKVTIDSHGALDVESNLPDWLKYRSITSRGCE